MKRKIYIASSWKNSEDVLLLTELLRANEHEVYAFCEPGKDHFIFDAREHGLADLTAKQAVADPTFIKAYEADKGGLDWADTCVILLPAGKSTHLEGGYIVGCGKDLFVLGDPVPGDFDAMYGFAVAVCETRGELLGALSAPALAPAESVLTCPACSSEDTHVIHWYGTGSARHACRSCRKEWSVEK